MSAAFDVVLQSYIPPVASVGFLASTPVSFVDAASYAHAHPNSLVVRNKKQYNTAKDRGKAGDTHAATFADEVQRLCSMLPTDDFIQSITLTHARVPCVILYNKRQLCDLRQLNGS